jgi:8-oxo-dGTP pyrophosphatase MutT (NUDIX family)
MDEIFWQSQLGMIQRALQAVAPPDPEELLILRDMDGTPARPMEPPAGVTPRESSVLLLLYPQDGELWFPLTVRSSRLTTHRGEVSLPGGGVDPEDIDAVATALREAEEELGVAAPTVEVLGRLTSFYIPPSNNRITPIVGLSRTLPTFRPDPLEVERVFYVPLRHLLTTDFVREEVWERRGVFFRVPFFFFEGYKVWGATALLLSELAARVRRMSTERST